VRPGLLLSALLLGLVSAEVRADDCEGEGGPCNTGRPGICAQGVLVCEDDELVCVRQNDPQPEACDNGQDDDCDGATDAQDADCAAPPACPDQDDDGFAVCGPGCAPGGGDLCGDCDDARPGVNPGEPEDCDGRDDDCDGAVDEGDPGGGQACLTGELGACAAGTTQCGSGSLDCVPDRTPVPEVCSGGVDEDCDGDTDGQDADCVATCPDGDGDGFAVCSGSCRPAGDCGDCDDGRAEVFPGAPETCNGVDDDCDGSRDEGDPGGGFACATGQLGVCAEGTRHCRDGALVCERNTDPSAEACGNGQDDDCDGLIDLVDPDCAPACPDADGDGWAVCGGGCRTSGGDVCGDCDDLRPGVNPGETEDCDGRDDDCDGAVDEGDPGGGGDCSTGEPGICASGTRHCVGGALECTRDRGPIPVVCGNGQDDDCDGRSDANDPNCAPICADQDGDGYYSCVSGCLVPTGARCGDCDDSRSSVRPGVPETCNGRDDDCDAFVDDGNPGGGSACSTGLPGACSAGLTACRSGDLVCVGSQQPRPEVCGNGQDDDCDGDPDAEDPDCIPVCADGDSDGYAVCAGGCRLAGADRCGDCNDASPNVRPGVSEACNGVDDDCDGTRDEGNPGGGASCDSGQPGACREGTRRCTSGQLVCEPDRDPSEEVCGSGGDEDCDGFANAKDPECIPACEGKLGTDTDADAVPDCADNCPRTSNRQQADFDADAIGDACETGAVAADIDLSGRVDGRDLAILGRAFARQKGQSGYAARADLDRDGTCDGDDLAVLAGAFAQSAR
jgi:hypothetical protein